MHVKMSSHLNERGRLLFYLPHEKRVGYDEYQKSCYILWAKVVAGAIHAIAATPAWVEHAIIIELHHF